MINQCSCGGNTSVRAWGRHSKQVACEECGANGIPGSTGEEAVILWNTPVIPNPHSFGDFPKGAVLRIEKVLENEYRIGYTYENRTYSPGFPSYYKFGEAMERCYRAYADAFVLGAS